MFGHIAAGSSRRWTYGCLPPVEGMDAIRAQMRLAHIYRNGLVEIERKRRADVEAALRQDPDVAAAAAAVDALEQRAEELRQAIRNRRQRARADVPADEEKAALTPLWPQLKAAREPWKAARKAALETEPIKAALAEINQANQDEQKALRATSGLYWGTYLTVEQGMMRARQSPTPPRFESWTGDGTLAVQCQHGLPVADLFSGRDTRLRLDPVDLDTLQYGTRGERRRAGRTKLWFRVGSEGREPVWAVLPMILHRPLPKDGKIKWAHLIRTKVGPGERWDVQFTVETPDPITLPKTGSGAAGIDVGWRLVADGLRVAYLADDADQQEELVLPAAVLGAFAKVEDLRSIRDQAFNETRARLAEFMRAGPMPEWLQSATTHLHAWRSPDRLARLVRTWQDRRYEGDETVYTTLEAWRYHDFHLSEYEANLREQVHRRRQDLYRVWAARIAERYAVVVLEKFDLRRMARQKPAEDGVEEHQEARHQRRIAAVSTLRQCLREACAKRGALVLEAPAEYTTQKCHVCGRAPGDGKRPPVPLWDAAPQIMHTCARCGKLWDQDFNAARNLLTFASTPQSV